MEDAQLLAFKSPELSRTERTSLPYDTRLSVDKVVLRLEQTAGVKPAKEAPNNYTKSHWAARSHQRNLFHFSYQLAKNCLMKAGQSMTSHSFIL